MSSIVSNNMSHFQHVSLKDPSREIRLVKLHPARSEQEPIKCQLQTVNEDETTYEALSYAWGDSTARHEILIEDKRFFVATNLFHALRNLRHISDYSTSKRVLWIDAICIDQTNGLERNQQVQRMASIYKSAAQVAVWLGGYHEPEDCIPFEPEIWGFDSLPPGNKESTEECFQLWFDFYLDKLLNPTLRCWGYLSLMYQRNWFQRLWVVQEIVMAKSAVVVCGRVCLSWNVLLGGTKRIYEYFRSPGAGQIYYDLLLGRIQQITLLQFRSLDILSIIHATRYMESSDPRDRLFAIKGLIGSGDSDIVVDYSKDINDIYRDWTLRYIERTGNLDVLLGCTPNKEKHEISDGLPSWVPDLRNWLDIDADLFESAHGFDMRPSLQYQASGTEQCILTPTSPENKYLLVQAIKIGKILTTIPSNYEVMTPFNNSVLQSSILICEKEIEAHFHRRGEERAALHASFIDVLFKGRQSRMINSLDVPEEIKYDHFSEEPRPSPISHQPYETLEPILAALVTGMVFFITDTGSIGSVPDYSGVEIGDEVFVLIGGNAPFVLCSVEEIDAFQLRGPCYVNGYMEGQAIAAWKSGELNIENIKLL